MSSVSKSNMIKMMSMSTTRYDHSKVVMVGLMSCAMKDKDLERMVKEKNFRYDLKISSW